MSTITLGDVEIIRVFELPLIPLPRAGRLPGHRPGAVAAQRGLAGAGLLRRQRGHAAVQHAELGAGQRRAHHPGGHRIGNAKQCPGDPALHEPDESSCFDEDEAAARATRRRVLARVADERMLLVPAHLPAAGAVEVGAAGDGYTISGWGAFE